MMNKDIENLYKKSQQDSSPLALDNFIINQAKSSNAVNNNSKSFKKWLFPLSTAAVVVMSFSVILNLQHENEQFIPEPMLIKENDNTSLPQVSSQLNLVEKDEIKNLVFKKAKRNSEKREIQKQNEVNIESIPATTESYSVKDDYSHNLITEESIDSIEEKKAFSQPAKKPLAESDLAPTLPMAAVKIEASRNNNLKDEIVRAAPTPKEQVQLGAVLNKERSKKTKPDEGEGEQTMFDSQLQQFQEFIQNQELTQAKELLNQLKVTHPEYDFSKLEQQIISKLIN